MVQVADGRKRVRADYVIGRQAHVSLELANARLGRRPEDAVHVSAEEPEGAERLLQFEYVMTVEIGHAQVQRSVADAVRRVDQCGPRALIDLVAFGQARLFAKRPHCRSGAFAEHAVDARLFQQFDDRQPLLDVFDRRSAVSRFDSAHCHDDVLHYLAEHDGHTMPVTFACYIFALLQAIDEPVGH